MKIFSQTTEKQRDNKIASFIQHIKPIFYSNKICILPVDIFFVDNSKTVTKIMFNHIFARNASFRKYCYV